MRRTTQVALLALALPWLAGAASRSSGRDPGKERPFFDAREHRTEYAGPRCEPAPAENVAEIRIGYFGPADPRHPAGGDMWRAAQLAVEQVNAAGGCRGKPVRLLPAWSENPWGTGVRDLARLVYQDQVRAIVGGPDGPSTHLAEQVVAKARLTLLSPVSTDKTVNLANVPWMFSLAPGDHLTSCPLAAEVSRRVGGRDLVLLSADDHDSRVFVAELKKGLAKHGIGPRRQFEFHRGAEELGNLAAEVLKSKPAAVVVAADAEDSARLVAALRAAGFVGEVFGGPSMGRRRFVDLAGGAAAGVVFPLLYDPAPQVEAGGRFSEVFQRRYAIPPDYAAACTYDAVQLLVAAIGEAGLNRARIRDAVAGLSAWSGATGSVRWDGLGGNTRAVPLGTIKDGRVRHAAEPRVPGGSTPR